VNIGGENEEQKNKEKWKEKLNENLK